MILEINESQLHAKKSYLEQLNTTCTAGTNATFQKIVNKLKNKLGNNASQIKISCLTNDCIV